MEEDTESLHNELHILRGIDHPNILKLFEYFEDDKRYYIVTDYCKGGDLFDEISNRGRFNEEDASIIIKGILSCINYLHSPEVGIVHRNVKPENLLLESAGSLDQIKLIDFGASIFFDGKTALSEIIGTPYYIAPEILAR